MSEATKSEKKYVCKAFILLALTPSIEGFRRWKISDEPFFPLTDARLSARPSIFAEAGKATFPVISIAQEKLMKVLMWSEQPYKLGRIFHLIPIADPRECDPLK